MTYSKYHAKKVTIDGVVFDSLTEGERYKELKLLERAGEIANLETHPKYTLQKGFTHKGKKFLPITYTADFRYVENGEVIVEDVKSQATQTAAFRIRMRLLLYKYPEMNFRITGKPVKVRSKRKLRKTPASRGE